MVGWFFIRWFLKKRKELKIKLRRTQNIKNERSSKRKQTSKGSIKSLRQYKMKLRLAKRDEEDEKGERKRSKSN